jgi:hypothetical protein
MTDWMTLPELVAHSRLSLATLKRAITREPNKLPSYLVAGRRLVRQSEYDLWATGKLARPLTLRKSKKLARIRTYATKPEKPVERMAGWRTGGSTKEPDRA